ncbi:MULTISPECIES: CcoQ/FixQ family Cbb3-type cytochrome c oxidase assembly chaperone [Cloacibacterium]|jgi:cbb3-type cytochrome oxidase subunit 3|uniref:CcoQ/FixQ family Cbb3-type cytochrome c oxidase assembly chaperone n=1 Tax=Cloacibacterium TaxID=501783 RepID=UPI00237DC7D8|nr:CcoQ/FixQ family Cbb3-type cytochrome c oxidase assembly chaperone [Cloacibacterium sp. TD35]MBV2224115.1 CcoQ/FixQ family Cbb3-type cytochrome c oxidase assembly chaperone [Cloacibacterium sp.]WDT68430.1 CcoQ/FixQ family Cbb3-type cytochrome c oxidase assembly chaperone [Cloacibacterium sp. TD35]
MIPSNIKDILANIDNAGIYQTLSMIIFIIFFISTVLYVLSRPKKHYSEVEKAPLEDDHNN